MLSTTLPGAVGEFAASRHGAFSRRQAAESGLTPAVLRRLQVAGIIREVAPGVFVLNDAPDTWQQRQLVATLCCNACGVAGFEAAAALHRADGFPPGPVCLLLPAPRKIRLVGVQVHVGPVTSVDLTTVDGIRCTTIERTLCDLGSVASELLVTMAFEHYWRSHTDLNALRRAADRLHRPGQHGTKLILDLLESAPRKGRPTESALEVRLESIIGDVDGLVRQHEVYDEGGRFIARVDFAIPSLQLAFEAHSREFHSGSDAHARDLRRHSRLEDAGWRVRYVTTTHMDDPVTLRAQVNRLVTGLDHPALPAWEPPRT